METWDQVKVIDNEMVIMNPILTTSKSKYFINNFEKIQFKKPYGYKLSIIFLKSENIKNLSVKLNLLNEQCEILNNPASKLIEPLQVNKKIEKRKELSFEIIIYFAYNTTSFLMNNMNFRLNIEVFSDKTLLSNLRSPIFFVKSKKDEKNLKKKIKKKKEKKIRSFSPKSKFKRKEIDLEKIVDKINKNIEYINYLNFKNLI
jgi:hypothetical protein